MADFFVHEKGICESVNIGKETKIWAFAHVLKGARIGAQCNICDGVFIENDVMIGDRVTVKCGVQLWDGVVLEDDVFIGPNATFTNDNFPRSKKYPDKFLKTIIRKGASIGANATILPGLEIGMNSMIGAGSVVTMNVPANAVVCGNPARITRYLESKSIEKPEYKTGNINVSAAEKDMAFFELKNVNDMRGNLSVAEFDKDLPFVPKRFFMVYDVPTKKVRGQHAHRICRQFLVCVKGSVNVMLDDGKNRREYVLDKPCMGVYIAPMVWGVQYNYSKDAVLLVFASEEYNENDYIRKYEDWLDELKKIT